ncbi:hypothetical protein ACAF76_018185 [Brevibacillus sp. TJ4]|uniref:hypothetical protein n=1 Tax=Brevibacillus sp. TJ4 TaxID=3234853 RepID=UPI003BA05FB2
MKRFLYVVSFIIAFSMLFGCSSEVGKSEFIQSVSQEMVHLNDGTPKQAKEYFEKKITEEGDGGLHVFHQDGKSYLMLAEQNRMISSVQEFTDHVRVVTTFSPSSSAGGTFNGENKIPPVLYITVIDKIEKPYGVFREEQIRLD